MNKKSETDVLVIGGGPAGAMAAKYAASGGVQTILLEQKKVIGLPIRCGEFFPTGKELAKIFPRSKLVPELFDIPLNLIAQPTKIVRVYSPKWTAFDIPMEGHSVFRNKFEQYLQDQAIKAGALVSFNSKVLKIQEGMVYTEDTVYHPKVIILACGPNRKLLNPLGISIQKDTAACVQYVMKNLTLEPEVVEMYYGNVSPGGYAWVIPKGNDVANIGLGIRKNFYDQNILKLLDKFMQMSSMAERTADGQKISTIAGLVPVNGPVECTVRNNILLVGDAAGHVMATNGGGIPTVMICGRIAGEVSAEHIKQGRSLLAYEQAWRHECGREFSNALRTRKRADFVVYRCGWLAEGLMRLAGTKIISRALKCAFVGP